jgi:hypothetical protein
MISSYLNQTAIWHQVTEKNEYAEPIFADPVTIPVRWEGKRRLVRNKDGQEVVSEARVLCTALVQEGDLLEYNGRAWPVIVVSPIPALDGTINHQEVAV